MLVVQQHPSVHPSKEDICRMRMRCCVLRHDNSSIYGEECGPCLVPDVSVILNIGINQKLHTRLPKGLMIFNGFISQSEAGIWVR